MRKTLTAAVFVAMSIATLNPAIAEVANDAKTLALAARIDNNRFDRADLMLGNQVQYWQPVFETLITEAPNGDLVPNLATAWSYNDDRSELTLTLRDGIAFSDGTMFNAAAVQANPEYLAARNGQNSYMARSITGYDLVSATEIKLHLGAPDPALVSSLALVGGAMASPATLGVAGSEVLPVGTGPYVYDAQSSVAGSQYVYRRNPGYWNPAAYPFEIVTITPITDNVARVNAVLAGQADGTIANTRAVAQAEASGLKVHKGDVNWAGIILADRAGTIAPELADVRVRKAINMAFDEASILKFVDLGYGRLTDQIFPDYSQAYDPALDDFYA